MVIGLDGMSLSLTSHLIDLGIMPNLKALFKRGTYGKLRSVIPPITPAAWTSFQTGKYPNKHGVVNFFVEFYYQVPKIVLSVSILIVMFFINPIFAVVSLFPTVLTVFLVKVLGKKIFLYRTNSRKNTKEVTSFLNNFFENTEYFYMIGNRERVISAYERKCQERSKSEIRDRIFDSLLGSISGNSA